MKSFFYSSVIAVSLLSFSAASQEYTILKEQSTIGFSGTHAGDPFEGNFEHWESNIYFDADKLQESNVMASFQTNSATTGNALYDGTLPQADWFAVEKHPTAQFVSSQISATEQDGQYLLEGTLSLRGITHPVSFPFTLTPQANNTQHMQASFAVDRLRYNIGQKSDPEAEWVSREITITLNITATTNERIIH